MSEFVDKVWAKEENFLGKFPYAPSGGLTKIDYNHLESLFNKVKKKTIKIADVGSWTGNSTILLASLAKQYKGMVYSIDWFKGNINTHLYDVARYVNIRNILEDNLKENDLTDYITIIEKSTEEAVKEFTDGTFSLIFLDADHRYEVIKKDIRLWYPKLKDKGILCGHDCELLITDWDDFFRQIEVNDCSHLHIGVIKAVSEELKSVKLMSESTMWYIEKYTEDCLRYNELRK